MTDRKLLALCLLQAVIALSGLAYITITRLQLRSPYWIPLALFFLVIAIKPALMSIKQIRMMRALSAKSMFSVKQPPSKKDSLWFGRGFSWGARHVWGMKKMEEKSEESRNWVDSGEEGGDPRIHGIGALDERDVFLPVNELAGHAALVGTTRVGKTRLAELLLVQMVARGEPMIIFDPKGEPELLNAIYSRLAERGEQDRFQFFSPAFPEASATYNPLGTYEQITDIADRVTAVLSGGSDAQPFKDYCHNVVLQIARGLEVAGQPINLDTLNRFSFNSEFTGKLLSEVVSAYLKKVNYTGKYEGLKPKDMGDIYASVSAKTEVKDDACEGLSALFGRQGDHFEKMSSNLSTLLARLTEGKKKNILCQGESDIDWLSVVENKKVVYFYMGSLTGPLTANGICKMALQDLSSFIGTRYIRSGARSSIWMFIDEFQDVDYDGFVGLLAKSGGAGLKIMLAMQSIADLKVKTSLGDSHARQILANTGVKIFLRAADAETAKEFTDRAGDTRVPDVTEQIGITPEVDDAQELFDATHRRTRRFEKEAKVKTEWITSLPKGQAFMAARGGSLLKIRMPMLAPPACDYFSDFNLRGESAPKL